MGELPLMTESGSFTIMGRKELLLINSYVLQVYYGIEEYSENKHFIILELFPIEVPG